MLLTPESNVPGAPVATANPQHQPRVPTAAGVPPYCSCGFVGGFKAGERLADHLKAMDPAYGTPAPALPATVKRADLFGHVEDTYATEGEMNGWRAQQAHLVGKQGGLL